MAPRIRAALAAAVLTVFALSLSGCGESSKPEPGEVALTADPTEQTVTLRWDPVEGSDRFRLFRKAEGDRDFRFIDDVTEGGSYIDEYVSQGTEYVYKLRVFAGETVLAEGVSAPVDLHSTPRIVAIRQIEGSGYEVEWDRHDGECAVYGKTGSGWQEIGRSANGILRFENTGYCTALSVSSTEANALLSEPVPICRTPVILSATGLDSHTNVVELVAPNGDWSFELARADTEDGVYTTVGSSDSRVIYDILPEKDTDGTADAETALPCWYRFRCLGDRFTGAWSEPVKLGTNARDVFYVPVIVYHEFLTAEEYDETADFADDVITPEAFESDLIWLQAHGYSTITTAALAAFLEGGAPLPEKPVILAIDDGKYSVYRRAWPLLMKYGMQASLSVIGDRIDEATAEQLEREHSHETFCTWDEIKEMHDSGAMEITSHTQSLHAYSHDGRNGANCGPDETVEQFLPAAQADAEIITAKIEALTGSPVAAMVYPYSIRSAEADRAWLAAGYRLLLCGNTKSVHYSRWNPMILEAGLNENSSLLRRMTRVTAAPVSVCLEDYEELLAKLALAP